MVDSIEDLSSNDIQEKYTTYSTFNSLPGGKGIPAISEITGMIPDDANEDIY